MKSRLAWIGIAAKHGLSSEQRHLAAVCCRESITLGESVSWNAVQWGGLDCHARRPAQGRKAFLIGGISLNGAWKRNNEILWIKGETSQINTARAGKPTAETTAAREPRALCTFMSTRTRAVHSRLQLCVGGSGTGAAQHICSVSTAPAGLQVSKSIKRTSLLRNNFCYFRTNLVSG